MLWRRSLKQMELEPEQNWKYICFGLGPTQKCGKIARAVHQLCFFQSKYVLSDCMSIQRCTELSWECRNNWDTQQRTGLACLVAHSCHTWLCWFWHKAYWAQTWGQAEPDHISSVFGCQRAFSPSEGKRRTPFVSLPVSYCVSDSEMLGSVWKNVLY